MDGKEYENWLACLKVGDKVATAHSYYGTTIYDIAKIEKITPTRQIQVTGYSARFKNGREMGDHGSWSFGDKLVPITDEVRENIKRRKLLATLNGLKFDELKTEQLEQITAIVKGE